MEKVILRYDGVALEEHEMNLDVLSEALVGLNSLIKDVHHSINGDDSDLNVSVQGGFDEGSFEFILNVIEATDVSTLAAIGFGSPVIAGGLIGALKWLQGEKISRISYNNTGNCLVYKENGEHIEVAGYLKDTIASASVRTSVKKLIQKPLNKDGVETFEVLDHRNRAQFTVVEEGEAACFKSHRSTTLENVDDVEIIDNALITFISVHSDKPSGWRINFDDETLIVRMSDNRFFRRLSGEAVFDDAYRVRISAAPKPNSIEKAYTIEEVYI
jgi:hypothetical protein